MSKTIYNSAFAKYLPQPLTHDPKMIAFANIAEKELLNISGLVKTVLIYPRINELSEELLDILAYDLHIDWYDYDYPIEIKRNLVKNSVKVHSKLGTKYAVESVLKDIYGTAKIEEWFEYGGSPYMFKVEVDVSENGLSESISLAIENKMHFYKNLRSHCEGIFYKLNAKDLMLQAIATQKVGAKLKVNPLLQKDIKTRTKKTINAVTYRKEQLKVNPSLEKAIKTKTSKVFVAQLQIAESIKIVPLLVKNIKANAEKEVKSTLFASEQITINPLLKKEITLETGKTTNAYLKTLEGIVVNPLLTEEIKLSVKKEIKSIICERERIEVKPYLPDKLSLSLKIGYIGIYPSIKNKIIIGEER